MVAAKHDWSGDLTLADGLVEGEGDLGPAFAVSVEDAGLRPNHEVVPAGFLYPMNIIVQLPLNLLRRCLKFLFKNIRGYLVGLCEVFRLLAHADPAERSETVVEIERPHDVLDVGRIAERAVGLEYVRSRSGGFQQEGVAVVKEVHSLG